MRSISGFRKHLSLTPLSDANMDTDLFFETGLSLFGHQCVRGCLQQFRRFISVSYLSTKIERGTQIIKLTDFHHGSTVDSI